jgi:choline dehydrogenase-like flavoprotein
VSELRLHEPRRNRFEGAADVVIIGSGAAGAAAADVFTEAGLRVLILDEGHVHPPGSFTAPFQDALGSIYRGFGAVPARGRGVLPLVQAKAVGGTTLVNGGITWRLPGAVHAEWEEAGFAEGLPLEALHREYDVLDRLLGVGEVPEVLLGGNGGLLARAAERTGTPAHVIRRTTPGCIGAARCTQGCPHGAKSSMDRSLLPRACARGASILPGARVDRVERDGKGRARAAVGVLVDRSGARVGHFRVLAEQAVILAASATGTAVLLARSRARRGVGRGFMAHPGLGLVGIFSDPVRADAGATQAFETDFDPASRIKIESLALPASVLVSRLPGVGKDLAEGVELLPRLASWGVQVRARAEGRIRSGWLGRRIRYDLTDQDIAVAAEGLEQAAFLMFAAGAEAVFPGVHGLPGRIGPDDVPRIREVLRDPRQAHFVATHLFGGARRGPDAKVHPVDLDFAVRDLPGAYVLDSSVFPSNLGVNPQHTMMAVARLGAWRIVESLARR